MSTDGELERMATLGGPGWQARAGSHASELDAGQIWHRCGSRSEVSALAAVALCRPPASIGSIADVDAALMVRPVDLARLRAQADEVAGAYRAAGARVVWLDHAEAPPNLLFLRDTFFMTAHGAIVARMGSRQRAGEERIVAGFLAGLGIPIVATITTGTFEGADALWTSPGSVLIGVGKRTSPDGAAAVARALADQGVRVDTVPLSGPVQHLLGAVNFADRDLAVVDTRALGQPLERALARFRLIRLAERDELAERRGMNFVAVRPGEVLMPAGCPRIREQLEAGGVATREVAIGEYVNAAGGIGCATGILERARE